NGPRAPGCAATSFRWRKTTGPEGVQSRPLAAWRREVRTTLVLMLLLLCAGALPTAPAQVGDAPAGGLRAQWIGLTRDVAWPATWQDEARFHYRKTVEGGFAFVSHDLASGRGEPAFDHAAIARAL